MKKYILLFILMGSIITTGISQNRNTHERIKASKTAFITNQLELTPEEAQSFWPVYNKYEEQRFALREDFRPERKKDLSEAESKELIKNFFQREQQELDLKKQLFAELQGIISANKMVKLHLAEKRFKQKLLERMNNRKDREKPKRR